MQKNLYTLGLFFIFSYCLIYSISQVFTGHYEQSINAYLLAAYIFLITVLFYFFVNCLRFKDILRLISKNRALVIKINISTALGWLTVIYALKYISPAEALALNFGILPIATMVISLLHKKTTKPALMDFIFSIILFVFILILCFYLIYSDLIANLTQIYLVSLAILLCVISGIANAYNGIYAKILNQSNFSASQVLGVRFYLSLIVATIILLFSQNVLIPRENEMVPIILIAATSTTIPIYILQLGINYTNAIAIALITPILPAMTFFFQLFDPRIKFSLPICLLTCLISTVILSAAVYKIRQQHLLGTSNE